MNTIEMYDAQAGTIKVEDIVTNRINWSILRRLKSNNDDGYELCIQDDFDDEEDIYAPEGALDLGWLGYFIGKNDHLKELQLNGLEISEDIDKVTSFYRGLCNNKSINTLEFNGVNLLGGKIFSMLGPFFENNHNLTSIEIRQYDFGFEESRLLALAIGSSKNKSLRNVELSQTNISGMGMVDIITSLSVHPYLEKLELWGNRLDTKGCRALSALLQNSVTELEAINLSSNEINDEGMDILIPALKELQSFDQADTKLYSLSYLR